MDESVIRQLEQASKTMSLSAAMRLGHDLIREERSWFLRDGCGCAIGAALATRGYTNQDQLYGCGSDFIRAVAKMFHVPFDVVGNVSHLHYSGQKTRLELCAWLESKGY